MNAYVQHNYKSFLIEIKSFPTHNDLFVDGKLLDSQKGSFSVDLSGVLPNGENVLAKLKWSIWKPKCSIYVNGKLLEE